MAEPHLVLPPSEGDRAAGEEARAMLLDVAVVLGAFLAAGTLAGILWPTLVDPVLVTRTDTGIAADEVALSNRFSNDGWYAVLGGVGGLGLGVALTAWRRTHEVVTLLVVVAGALVAALVSAQLGHWLGPDDPSRALADAAVGATAADVVDVTAEGAYLVWPIAAVAGALIVLWGPSGDQRVHRPRSRSRLLG
jgi:hypothetical protein